MKQYFTEKIGFANYDTIANPHNNIHPIYKTICDYKDVVISPRNCASCECFKGEVVGLRRMICMRPKYWKIKRIIKHFKL